MSSESMECYYTGVCDRLLSIRPSMQLLDILGTTWNSALRRCELKRHLEWPRNAVCYNDFYSSFVRYSIPENSSLNTGQYWKGVLEKWLHEYPILKYTIENTLRPTNLVGTAQMVSEQSIKNNTPQCKNVDPIAIVHTSKRGNIRYMQPLCDNEARLALQQLGFQLSLTNNFFITVGDVKFNNRTSCCKIPCRINLARLFIKYQHCWRYDSRFSAAIGIPADLSHSDMYNTVPHDIVQKLGNMGRSCMQLFRNGNCNFTSASSLLNCAGILIGFWKQISSCFCMSVKFEPVIDNLTIMFKALQLDPKIPNTKLRCLCVNIVQPSRKRQQNFRQRHQKIQTLYMMKKKRFMYQYNKKLNYLLSNIEPWCLNKMSEPTPQTTIQLLDLGPWVWQHNGKVAKGFNESQKKAIIFDPQQYPHLIPEIRRFIGVLQTLQRVEHRIVVSKKTCGLDKLCIQLLKPDHQVHASNVIISSEYVHPQYDEDIYTVEIDHFGYVNITNCDSVIQRKEALICVITYIRNLLVWCDDNMK